MTQLLLDQLRSGGDGFDYVHVDTSVSRSNIERETFRWHKVVTLIRQVGRGLRLSARGFDPYYPISQTTIGLARDVALLLPYRLAGRSMTIHLHGGALDEALQRQPRVLSWLVRKVAGGHSTVGIVLTPNLTRCLTPLAAPERIHVVGNAINARSAPLERSDPAAGLRVLFLSTVVASKGYRELVDAVMELADEGIPIEVGLAGEPWTEDDKKWLDERKQAPGVQVLGHLDEDAKWQALAGAHVLALPSIMTEGQPLTILEGMAAGCAILTTAVGGIPDTVSKEEGAVLPALAGAELQTGIEDVLRGWSQSPEILEGARRAARARFEREYAVDRFYAAWLHAMGLAPNSGN